LCSGEAKKAYAGASYGKYPRASFCVTESRIHYCVETSSVPFVYRYYSTC
jgi:hypothetical protein